MNIETNYSSDEIINTLRDNTYEVKSLFTLNPFHKFTRMRERAIFGVIENGNFELGVGPNPFASLRAYGKLTPRLEGTNIEIKFIKNYLFIAGFFRWNYEKEIILDFLLTLFKPGYEKKKCKEDIYVFSKAAIPEKNNKAFMKEQDKICSEIAAMLVKDVPESWNSATLKIIVSNGDLACHIHNADGKSDKISVSDELVNEVNKLRDLFYAFKNLWKSANLKVYWDYKIENWRFEIDYKYRLTNLSNL